MAKKKEVLYVENEYQDLIDTMKLSPKWQPVLDRYTLCIQKNKDKYEEVSIHTGVPWEMIGTIHAMEGGCDFSTHLHNGDPLTRRTKQEPPNRPVEGKPPFTWEESAIDALLLKGLDKIEDWTDARVAYELERYNGFGYKLYHKDVLTPYLWSGTNHYTKGKYTTDGKWNGEHVSKQLGAMPLYLNLKTVPLTKKELIQNSGHLTIVDRTQKTIMGAGLGIGSLFSLDSLGMITTELQKVREIISENALLILGVAGVASYLIFQWVKSKNVKAYNEGRYTPSGVKEE